MTKATEARAILADIQANPTLLPAICRDPAHRAELQQAHEMMLTEDLRDRASLELRTLLGNALSESAE